MSQAEELRKSGGDFCRRKIVHHDMLFYALLYVSGVGNEFRQLQDLYKDTPNRANIRAGTPFASLMRTGRSGLCLLIVG